MKKLTLAIFDTTAKKMVAVATIEKFHTKLTKFEHVHLKDSKGGKAGQVLVRLREPHGYLP